MNAVEAASPQPGIQEPGGDMASGPIALLRPDARLVPFTGRQSELAGLRAWCTSGAPRSVRVIAGAGGVGKTRLALEVAAGLDGDGAARLVAAGTEASAVGSARAEVPGRLLLILDDSEVRRDLGALLAAVLADPGPIRVLLVARSLGEWWDRLIADSPPETARLLTEAPAVELDMLAGPGISDADLAEAAVPHFAAALQRPAPDRIAVERAARRVPILLVHAAALVAVLRSASGPHELRVIVSEGVLDELLGYEADYWRHSAAAADLAGPASLVRAVVAAATLVGAGSVPEAADVVARVPELAGSQEEQRLLWAKWLYDLYPSGADGRLGAMRPHLLAEAHVVGQLAADPVLTRSCLRDLPPEQAEHALTVLARASTYQSRPQQVIAAALRDDLAHLGLAAGRVAVHTWGEVGGLLADAIADVTAPPEVLAELALELPYPSVVLARAHLSAILRAREAMTLGVGSWSRAEWDDRAAQILAQLPPPGPRRGSTPDGGGHYRGDLARALSDLSIRLSEQGRSADALRAEQEAVTAYRDLADAAPGAYRGDLASSLTNLSIRHAELNQPGEALRAEQEAANVYRELATADPGAYRADLASSLTNLGVWYAELGRPGDAVASTREAVTIFRELATGNPEGFRPDLATSLTNLGIWHSQLGNPADALRAEQEAVTIRRELATADPARYRPDLATSLTNLVITLSELGRPADALGPAREAVTIRRELAADNPGRHRHHLARALSNLSNRYAELGRPAGALAPAKEAVTIRRQLAAADPARYQPDLARALTSLSSRLTVLDRPAEALAAQEEAVATYRELAAADPARYRSLLSNALTSLATILATDDREADAQLARAEAAELSAGTGRAAP